MRSSVPPTVPSKDSSTHSSFNASSRYINADLAEAVRDSVQIRSETNTPIPGEIDFSAPQPYPNNSRLSRPPSLNPLAPRRTPSPRVSQQDLTKADARMSYLQPEMPSQRVISAQNPFETDELEPVPFKTAEAGRLKPTRAQTGLGPTNAQSGSGKTRARRSMSTDSFGLDGKELTAGQKKAAEDKKGGRHADVIDTWDPTGLGSAMWHHSGPYDAAAPSRNHNLPTSKAPMRAFDAQAQANAAAKEARASSVAVAAPPIPPVKDNNDGPTKRAQAALDKKPTSSRRTSGGLTGQYSTSMPTSGGYFPNMDEPMDEAEIARRERQKQREEKRRALKAAWGIDTPEPFEDFGASPGADSVELNDDYSPDQYPVPLPTKSVRSPGLRFGTTPPILEDAGSPPHGYESHRPGPNGGVKRTKSLMQKIKTMVRTRAGSVEGAEPIPIVSPGHRRNGLPAEQRSPSGHANVRPAPAASPGWIDQEVVEEDDQYGYADGSPKGRDGNNKSRSSSPRGAYGAPTLPSGPASPTEERMSPTEKPERRSLFFKPSRTGSEKAESPTSPISETSEFVFVGSPEAKRNPPPAHPLHPNGQVETLAYPAQGNGHVAKNRAKDLPTPPVMPVLPDFGDLVPTRIMSRDDGLKRKTSMVKKFREKIK